MAARGQGARGSPRRAPRGGPPRGRGPSPPQSKPAAQKPHAVRKVRTEHGTRVARAIVCSRCGAKDTIRFAPKDPTKVLCRACAADVLGVGDPDTAVGSLTSFICSTCGRPGTTRAKLIPGEPYLCRDCLLGIESKQTDKTKTATRLSNRVVRVRRSTPSGD